LCEKVCQSLVDRLSSQYPGQIVQILTNLEHFEIACIELQELLFEARSSGSSGAPVVLRATEQFRTGKKTAEKRIFELVNSKIDDLIETAEYDWMATKPEREPSNYMQELTRYLSNIMSSVLLGLPAEIKELIYFDALSHAATMILSLPLDPTVKRITPAAVQSLALDVTFLSSFVDSLNNPILKENLDELCQTVALMETDNSDEFFDVSLRNRKYGRVDRENGAILIEKVMQGREIAQQTSPMKSSASDRFATIGSRFGLNI
jgi:exocyst complex component 6